MPIYRASMEICDERVKGVFAGGGKEANAGWTRVDVQ